jgi:hypothetical protein
MFLSRKLRFGEISQIFRTGFRTRGHARNKLSSVAVSDKGSVCADDVMRGLGTASKLNSNVGFLIQLPALGRSEHG